MPLFYVTPLPLTRLASVKSRLVLPFWYRLTRVVLDKGPLNWRLVLTSAGNKHFSRVLPTRWRGKPAGSKSRHCHTMYLHILTKVHCVGRNLVYLFTYYLCWYLANDSGEVSRMAESGEVTAGFSGGKRRKSTTPPRKFAPGCGWP